MKNDIISAMTPYGSMDIARCNEVLNEANVLDTDLVSFIREMDYEIAADVDLVSCAYDFIMMEARNEINIALGKDIMNDLDECINVAGNYCATFYDWTDKAQKETLELALQVKEPSKTLQWFINHIQ